MVPTPDVDKTGVLEPEDEEEENEDKPDDQDSGTFDGESGGEENANAYDFMRDFFDDDFYIFKGKHKDY